ncbi:hypothetical protein [Bacillus sp. T33-2]|uniref:hypothetical protein n=1 Tax=Bacillus sp. T33-2 TaxID=2054168 RepID=UPI000C756752|nr:hypothetical protein [Bacillus sp. T33-2]PLR94615.1 hypothetical protein CVD19_16730 [Bacillus sp. T33-2]
MDKKTQLIEQIKVVINNLEKDYSADINNGILQLIYKRYRNALEILNNNNDINSINISGGVRAYMDSYSDYENPFLGELYKAEKLYNELLQN